MALVVPGRRITTGNRRPAVEATGWGEATSRVLAAPARPTAPRRAALRHGVSPLPGGWRETLARAPSRRQRQSVASLVAKPKNNGGLFARILKMEAVANSQSARKTQWHPLIGQRE